MPDQLECTEVQVIGTDLPNFLAGRIEIRCNGDWRAVCDNMWDEREARIVCQVLGFEQRGRWLISIHRNFILASKQATAHTHALVKMTAYHV